MSKKFASLFILGLVLTCGLGARANDLQQAQGAGKALFTSNIVGSTVGQTVAGVQSGTAPWVVSSGTISLFADGTIKGRIRGLVIPGTGVGPVTRVAVSLVSGGSGGMVVATTQSFDLSSDGDARISDRIDLPAGVVAPVLLVRITALNGEDLPAPINYIASSGFGDASQTGTGLESEGTLSGDEF